MSALLKYAKFEQYLFPHIIRFQLKLKAINLKTSFFKLNYKEIKAKILKSKDIKI